jgi:hypothetical protein
MGSRRFVEINLAEDGRDGIRKYALLLDNLSRACLGEKGIDLLEHRLDVSDGTSVACDWGTSRRRWHLWCYL